MTRARVGGVLLLVAWTVLVVAIDVFLITIGRDDVRPGLAPFFVCASPGLILGGFGVWRSIEQERRARDLEQESLPVGSQLVVHVFAFALPARDADELAGAVEGLPAHRATSFLLRHLEDERTSRHLAIAPGADGHERTLERATRHITDAISREPTDYRGATAPAAADARACLLAYVLSARHVTEPGPMPREAEALAAWLEALVPLRPEDTLRVATVRSALAPPADVDRALASLDARTIVQHGETS